MDKKRREEIRRITEEIKEKLTTPLHRAVMKGDAEEVKELLEKEIEIDEKEELINGYTALGLAVVGDHKKITKLLLKNGANVDLGSNEKAPLEMAKSRKIKKLLKKYR